MPVWRHSMKNVLKKRTGGEVVKRARIAVAIAVTAKSGQRASLGQEIGSSTNENDFGKDDGNIVDLMPFLLEE